MAACRSLQHIFDKPLPLKKHEKSHEESLCSGDDSSSPSSPFSSSSCSPSSFSSSPFSSLSSTSSLPKDFEPPKPNFQRRQHCHSDSFVLSLGSLSICTENLGLESCEDVEISIDNNNDLKKQQVVPTNNLIRHRSDELSYYAKHSFTYLTDGEPTISRITGEEIPPPISSIRRNGKPRVCLKSFRYNGRFVLKKVRMPSQEFYLHSCRQDGRLKLQFVHSIYQETVEE